MSVQNPIAEFPERLEPLFRPARYKSIRGGRGSGKSWGVARALLILGTTKPLRILATREFQNSIAESVHKLLADQIDALGLASFYTVQKTSITGTNGTSFTFAGLHHNINSIKSMEAIDISWVEEAQTVRKASWDILIPMVRQPGSEIWLTWNPDLEEDDTYQRFVVHPDPRTVDLIVNWDQNPWFSEELRSEKDHLKSIDFNAYLNVWQGKCRQMVEGALWSQPMLSALRDAAPAGEAEREALLKTFRRIVVAVDPSGCSGNISLVKLWR